MRRRWVPVSLAALLAAVAVPSVALATTGTLSSTVDLQSAAWRLGAISTTSSTFQPVPGLNKRTVPAARSAPPSAWRATALRWACSSAWTAARRCDPTR